MKYTALTAATAALVATAAAGGYGQHDGRAWTPATRTQPPVAGFTLRPTLAPRAPRRGLALREDDDDDDDDDDNRAGKITRGSVTSSATATGSGGGGRSATMTGRPANTCGWDRNGGGFYACADSRASCQYTNGVAGCCSGDGCKKIPKTCVARGSNCDSDNDGGTLCCGRSSAPACFTWLISTSSAGKQETYSMFGCTDKPGTDTLLPTDPAGSSGGGGGGGGKNNTGVIVGGVIGGIIALLLIVLFIWYVVRQRRRGRAEDEKANRSLRNSQLSRGVAWVEGQDSPEDGEKKYSTYGAEQATAAVPRRRPVGSGGRSSVATTVADGDGTGSPNGQVTYSVSSASMTGSQAGTGVVSSVSPAPPPLDGVVEAPDTAVVHGGGPGAPVEVAGTSVTRNTMQNRAELP